SAAEPLLASSTRYPRSTSRVTVTWRTRLSSSTTRTTSPPVHRARPDGVEPWPPARSSSVDSLGFTVPAFPVVSSRFRTESPPGGLSMDPRDGMPRAGFATIAIREAKTFREQPLYLVRLDRLTEQEALHLGATLRADHLELLWCLHALGGRRHAEALG